MKKHSWLLFLFFFQLYSIHAQDWKADLLAMNKVYMESRSFKMNIVVKTFENKNDKSPVATYAGSVISANNNYYTVMMRKTTIYNKRCAIVIDDAQKIILYKKNKAQTPPQNFFSISNIDSAMIFFGKNVEIAYLVNNEKEKRIEIKYKSNTIEKMEISIDATNNTLKQIVYYYSSQPQMGSQSVEKVLVDYVNTQINKTISDEIFSESKYIKIKKDEVTPSDLYKKYEVINESAAQTN